MTKKSRQKFKYVENEKSFWDEIKNIFHYFWKTSIEANNNFFLKGEGTILIFFNFQVLKKHKESGFKYTQNK